MAAVQRDQTPMPPAVQERGVGPAFRFQTPMAPAVQERGTIFNGGNSGGGPGGLEFSRFNPGLETP